MGSGALCRNEAVLEEGLPVVRLYRCKDVMVQHDT
jgi:hypothetical protein